MQYCRYWIVQTLTRTPPKETFINAAALDENVYNKGYRSHGLTFTQFIKLVDQFRKCSLGKKKHGTSKQADKEMIHGVSFFYKVKQDYKGAKEMS